MSDLTNAIKQICDEKGLGYEAVITTIESALAAAYRKDYGKKNQNIQVEFDPETTKSKVFDVKTVVEDLPEEEEEAVDDNEQEESGQDGDKKGSLKARKSEEDIEIKDDKRSNKKDKDEGRKETKEDGKKVKKK